MIKVPGFRTGPKRNKIFGSIGYLALIISLIAVTSAAPTIRDSVVDGLAILTLFIGFLIPLANLFKARERFYLLNRTSKKGKISGYLGYIVICFIAFGLINSLESPTYKEMRAKQATERAALAQETMAKQQQAEKLKAEQAIKDKQATDEKAKVEADAKAKEAAAAKEKADQEAKSKADAEAKAKADEDAKKQAEEDAKKKSQQDAVIDFEKNIYAMENKAKPIMDNYTNTFNNLSNGQSSIIDAYGAASDAKKASKDLQYNIGTLKIPEGIPDDIDKLLSDSRSEISASYMLKSEAYDSVMKFLDEKKPSYAQDFKDKMKNADAFVISGVSKIMDAKLKLGIDVTKQQ